MPKSDEPSRVWKVAEAKARLSEVLRLSETEGPQVIGARKSYVVVPKRVWDANGFDRKPGQHPPHGDPNAPPPPKDRPPLGKWLVEMSMQLRELELSDRASNCSNSSVEGEESECADAPADRLEQHPPHGEDTSENAHDNEPMPFGKWLVENVPRGTNFEAPPRHYTRPIPFMFEDDE